MHIFVKAYHNFSNIGDNNDLCREHLTLAEYRIVEEGLKRLSNIDDAKFTTFNDDVANWFRKNDFDVSTRGINYVISV